MNYHRIKKLSSKLLDCGTRRIKLNFDRNLKEKNIISKKELKKLITTKE